MLFSNFFYRDIVPYLDEETQDALYYQDEDEPTFNNVPLLSSKLEKEISYMFPPSTLLIGLLQTMKKVASQLLDISDNEPYGVKGAKVILKLKYSNGSEESIGSFALDPNTVSYILLKSSCNCHIELKLNDVDQYYNESANFIQKFILIPIFFYR